MTTVPIISSNPLASFRTPDSIKAQTGETHFKTQREDVYNDTEGLSSIYPGEFTYKLDPSLEIDLALWEDDPDQPKSISLFYKMTGRDGYNVAMAKDWEVSERLRIAWKADVEGRLTLAGRSKKTLVLMWRTGESYDLANERRLRISNDVQKTAEEKQAEMQESLAPLGATVISSVRDDDGNDDDNDILPKGRKKTRR